VMGQLGHTDPAFTLRLYTHAMRRGEGERARLQAMVAGRTTALEVDGEHVQVPSAEGAAVQRTGRAGPTRQVASR
jgi:hypothetical protein